MKTIFTFSILILTLSSFAQSGVYSIDCSTVEKHDTIALNNDGTFYCDVCSFVYPNSGNWKKTSKSKIILNSDSVLFKSRIELSLKNDTIKILGILPSTFDQPTISVYNGKPKDSVVFTTFCICPYSFEIIQHKPYLTLTNRIKVIITSKEETLSSQWFNIPINKNIIFNNQTKQTNINQMFINREFEIHKKKLIMNNKTYYRCNQ